MIMLQGLRIRVGARLGPASAANCASELVRCREWRLAEWLVELTILFRGGLAIHGRPRHPAAIPAGILCQQR
jgi:hypothetical protein